MSFGRKYRPPWLKFIRVNYTKIKTETIYSKRIWNENKWHHCLFCIMARILHIIIDSFHFSFERIICLLIPRVYRGHPYYDNEAIKCRTFNYLPAVLITLLTCAMLTFESKRGTLRSTSKLNVSVYFIFVFTTHIFNMVTKSQCVTTTNYVIVNCGLS